MVLQQPQPIILRSMSSHHPNILCLQKSADDNILCPALLSDKGSPLSAR